VSDQPAPEGADDCISPDDEYHCEQMAEVTFDVLTSPIKALGNRPAISTTRPEVVKRLLAKSYVVSAEIAYKRGFQDGMSRAAGMVIRQAVGTLGAGADPLTAERLGEYADAVASHPGGPDAPEVQAVLEKHKGDPEFVKLSGTYTDLWRKHAAAEAEKNPPENPVAGPESG